MSGDTQEDTQEEAGTVVAVLAGTVVVVDAVVMLWAGSGERLDRYNRERALVWLMSRSVRQRTWRRKVS